MIPEKMIGVIPARMASSRFYGKPLTKILGKEMIRWVYEHSRGSTILNEIYIATDHEYIESFCKREGIPYVMTSPEHKNCAERTNEVCQRLGVEFVVEIQGDEPTLMANEIDSFINKTFENGAFDVAILYTDLSSNLATNENTVKLVVDKNSKALFFSRSPIPFNFRSKPMKYYKQIGLYLWRSEFLNRFSELPVGYLEGIEDTHMLRLIENHFDTLMIYARNDAIGVDVPEDIEKVESFLVNTKTTG